MNSRTVARSLVIVFLGAAALAAGEPWKEKPYTEWSQKEVDQISQDSPWSRMMTLPGGRAPGEAGIARSEVSGTRSTSGDESQGVTPQAAFLVQWASALTLREARVRRQQLRGLSNPEEATRLLSGVPPHYVIVVVGSDMRGFQSQTEEGVKGSSYLELKQSKQRIVPEIVRLVRQGDKVVEADLFFPREREGKLAIGPEEKGVKFACKVGTLSITADFDLRKMSRAGVPDL